MVLLPTNTLSTLRIFEAVKELTLAERLSIRLTNLFVFLDLYEIKSNLSAKVLYVHSGFKQNIFLLFKMMITCLSCIGRS